MIYALVIVAVVLAIARVWSPWRTRPQGQPILSLRMPLRARLRNQALPLALLVVAVVLNAAWSRIPEIVAVAPLLAVLGGTLIPARYTVTTEGIAIGALTFRRWTEFSGISVRRGRIRFKSIRGTRRLDVWLPGRFHDADTVAEIRRLMRDAYRGRSSASVTPAAGAAESDSSFVTI